MHLNEEARAVDTDEEESYDLDISMEVGPDDLLARWDAEVLKEEKIKKKKSKKSKKIKKVPIADVEISQFYKLPLVEVGRRLKWVSPDSEEYDKAWFSARVIPREEWHWCNEASQAYMAASKPPLPEGPPPEHPPPPPAEPETEEDSREKAIKSWLAAQSRS